MGLGTAIIVNLNTSQANAYNVFPSQHIPGTYGATKITLPASVMDAINGYNELKAAFDNYAAASGSFSQNSQNVSIFSSPSANGCGSPASWWSYPFIPDFPFRDACDKHDICYTTDRSKASCDGEFLYNMKQRVRELMMAASRAPWIRDPVGVVLFEDLMFWQANRYHGAVVNLEAAKDAYCAATSASNPPECRTTSSSGGGSYAGTSTSNVAGGGGGTLIQTCELWSFPDGNGGRYFMLRNCSFS
jgi:hypothetical protein